MDAKAKVQTGKIATRIEEIDATFELEMHQPVDPTMLQQFLSLGETKTQADYLAEVGHTLNRAQRYVASSDRKGLDAIAQELSHTALKVGAPKLLSSAIEVQGMARIGDFKNAADLLGRMEVELVEVKSHFS